MTTIRIDGTDIEYECPGDDVVLRAALRNGLGFPYECNVGSCGNCRFELLEGEVAHIWDSPPAWGERDLKRNRYLGCQAPGRKLHFQTSARPDPRPAHGLPAHHP
jgi:toluene monooxygenase electron transfer component